MRFSNWKHLQVEYLRGCAARALRYGRYDCALMAGGAVLAMTGRDNFSQFGPYKGRREADALMRRHGGLEAIARLAWGAMQPPACARDGDMVIATLKRGDTLGICTGTACAFPASTGVLYLPITKIRGCWSID